MANTLGTIDCTGDGNFAGVVIGASGAQLGIFRVLAAQDMTAGSEPANTAGDLYRATVGGAGGTTGTTFVVDRLYLGTGLTVNPWVEITPIDGYVEYNIASQTTSVFGAGSWGSIAVGAAAGIDDVLNFGQPLTTNRVITGGGNSLNFTGLDAFAVTGSGGMSLSSSGSNISLITGDTGALILPSGADPDTDATLAANGAVKYDSTDHDIRALVDGAWVSLLGGGQKVKDTVTATATNTIPNLAVTVPASAVTTFRVNGIEDYLDQITVSGSVVTVGAGFSAAYGTDVLVGDIITVDYIA